MLFFVLLKQQSFLIKLTPRLTESGDLEKFHFSTGKFRYILVGGKYQVCVIILNQSAGAKLIKMYSVITIHKY